MTVQTDKRSTPFLQKTISLQYNQLKSLQDKEIIKYLLKETPFVTYSPTRNLFPPILRGEGSSEMKVLPITI